MRTIWLPMIVLLWGASAPEVRLAGPAASSCAFGAPVDGGERPSVKTPTPHRRQQVDLVKPSDRVHQISTSASPVFGSSPRNASPAKSTPSREPGLAELIAAGFEDDSSVEQVSSVIVETVPKALIAQDDQIVRQPAAQRRARQQAAVRRFRDAQASADSSPVGVNRDPSSSRRPSRARSADVGVRLAGGMNPVGDGSGGSVELQPLTVPVRQPITTDRATLQQENDLVTLVATDAELRTVLRMIADHHQLNLVVGPEVDGPVTVSLRDARLDEVLDAIVGVAGFHWHRRDNVLYVTASTSTALDPKVQGRRLQVYPLNYVAAKDVEPVVTGLLSPIGKSFVTQASDTEKLQTQELLIVEDNETGHARIGQYIAQVDIAPPQVLVEAHVLQIDLDDEQRHGVDLTGLARIAGARLTLDGNGFAEDEAEGPSLAFRIDGNDVDGLIECIHANTASRTLASPKVSVVNRQTAKVQIGQRLPYAVATTTQTATIQNVQFLDVGIVLEVTPVITNDRNVLMTVLPKISGGRITESGFPEEDTTQVSTTVLMPDGSGLVIGGLIREVNDSNEAAVPGLSRVPVVKRLFTRQSRQASRNELVVALVTHVLDSPMPVRQRECLDLNEALPGYAERALVLPHRR